MGHVCYICKKKLKLYNSKWEKSDFEDENLLDNQLHLPPAGMTSKDRLCSGCYHGTPTRGSHEGLKQFKLNEGITSQQCDWCQKEVEISQMELPPRWIQNEHDHCQCIDCGNIIENLTSTKLKELETLQLNTLEKYILVNKQLGESYSDQWKHIDSDDAQNSSKQYQKSLDLKSLELNQQFTNIPSLILKEELVLAKKYFFNTDSNEHETKVGSPISIKASEDGDPIQILKVRLAKGEISLEEFNKIKEGLE
jgi:hypothetical protein